MQKKMLEKNEGFFTDWISSRGLDRVRTTRLDPTRPDPTRPDPTREVSNLHDSIQPSTLDFKRSLTLPRFDLRVFENDFGRATRVTNERKQELNRQENEK